jgi:hypothetical protein
MHRNGRPPGGDQKCQVRKIRLCVDHTRLNKFILRPTHPTRTPRDAVAEIDSECRFYTIFDAANGYYQIPLHPSCQHLTTFSRDLYHFQQREIPICTRPYIMGRIRNSTLWSDYRGG